MPVSFPSVTMSYDLIRIPSFRNTILTYGNKVEQRLAHWPTPQYTFQCGIKILTEADYDTIIAFFIARLGNWDSFNFTAADKSDVFLMRFQEPLLNFEYFAYKLWNLKQFNMLQVPA